MRTKYADIIVDISQEKLDRTFTYRIPEELEERIRTGSVVTVPFGSRQIKGYVVRIKDTSDLDEQRVKSIDDVITDDETADAKLVQLAAWMSHTYGSTTIQALKTVIPVQKKVQAKKTAFVRIKNRHEAEAYLDECRKKNYKAKIRVLEYLLDHPDEDGVLQKTLLEAANVPLSVVTALSKNGILEIEVETSLRKVVQEAKTAVPDILTEEQQDAVNLIRREWNGRGRPVLVNGITGSGKTLVYMELIADVLKEGKEAIVLIPEIALTHQTVLRFVARFGDQVSFLHSRLSGGERYDQMKAARQGAVKIMVGPRSALFTPFRHLGLIVIDEEHESTYHSEQMPRYHARETALKRAEIEQAHVVLGSATPSLESAHRVEEGQYLGVRLNSRFGDSQLPETEIVDMREELKRGNRSIFSDRLRKKMRECLEKHEQIILFLNRRGYEGHMTCRSCGHVVKCPHCDVSLTRHRNGHLVCHYCGYEVTQMSECPECHSTQISGFSIGTEQVEDLVRAEFPQCRTLRMDADTTRGKEGHTEILRAFGAHEADVLIGTQMIVKGHDFPLVTLVGVLMADLSLNESDYRSAEHTYELVTQAVGRAGRGLKKGCAVIQSYRPDHYSILAAAKQDYDAFYKEEMMFRSILGYPPAGAMTAVLGSSEDENLLMTGMEYIKKYIDRFDKKHVLQAIGPAPQSVGKVKDRYRMVIYLRNTDQNLLIRAKDLIEEYVAVNSGFTNIDIQFDLNV